MIGMRQRTRTFKLVMGLLLPLGLFGQDLRSDLIAVNERRSSFESYYSERHVHIQEQGSGKHISSDTSVVIKDGPDLYYRGAEQELARDTGKLVIVEHESERLLVDRARRNRLEQNGFPSERLGGAVDTTLKHYEKVQKISDGKKERVYEVIPGGPSRISRFEMAFGQAPSRLKWVRLFKEGNEEFEVLIEFVEMKGSLEDAPPLKGPDTFLKWSEEQGKYVGKGPCSDYQVISRLKSTSR